MPRRTWRGSDTTDRRPTFSFAIFHDDNFGYISYFRTSSIIVCAWLYRDLIMAFIASIASRFLLFMVENERITRLETADPRFRTKSGVRVGDSEADARKTYGKRLEVKRHKYYETGHYLIVRSADDRYALLMETDRKKIVYIRAGVWPSVGYWEGCN